MNILDKLLGKGKQKKQEQISTIDVPLSIEPIKEQTSTSTGTLDLSKRIELNLEKLDLNKPEVLEKTLFLLDVSGSMDVKIKGIRKIDSLRDVMDKYPNAEMICFSSGVNTITKSSEIPEPYGGTNLAHALEYISRDICSSVRAPERIVLVSDGEPDSNSGALDEAKTLGLPIDIIFIGSKGSDGEKFMKELSSLTWGKHFTV